MSVTEPKKVFTKPLDGKDVVIAVRLPNADELKEAERIHAARFQECVNEGIWMNNEIDKILKQRGLWTDEDDKRYTELKKKLLDTELKVTKRTIPMQKGKHGVYDKSTAYGLCLQAREIRGELIELSNKRATLESNTAEAKASNARLNFLIYACTVYDTGGARVYSSYDDYLSFTVRKSVVDEKFDIACAASEAFQELFFGISSNFQDKLFENVFLKKYGFVDGTYHLVDSKSRRINIQGQLVDEAGRPIDESGNFIDVNGVPFAEDGEYLVEPKPFIDDDGKPIIDDEYKAELEAYKKKLADWEAKKKKTT
jgi:hypothetical protein